LLKPLRGCRHFHGNPVGVGRHGARYRLLPARRHPGVEFTIGGGPPWTEGVCGLVVARGLPADVCSLFRLAANGSSQKVNFASFATVSSGLQDLCSASILHIVSGNVLREERHVGSSLLQGGPKR